MPSSQDRNRRSRSPSLSGCRLAQLVQTKEDHLRLLACSLTRLVQTEADHTHLIRMSRETKNENASIMTSLANMEDRQYVNGNWMMNTFLQEYQVQDHWVPQTVVLMITETGNIKSNQGHHNCACTLITHEHSDHTHSNTSNFTAQNLLGDMDTTKMPPDVHDNILEIMKGNYYQPDTTQHGNNIHSHPGSGSNLQAPFSPTGRPNNFHNIPTPNADVPQQSFFPAQPRPQPPPQKRQKRQYRKRQNGVRHSYRDPIFNSQTGLYICPYGCDYRQKIKGKVVQHTDSCKKNFDRPLAACKYECHKCIYTHRSEKARKKHEKDCGYNPDKIGGPCTFRKNGCTYKHNKPSTLKRHQNACFYNPNKKSCPNADKGCPFYPHESTNYLPSQRKMWIY